MSNVMRLGSETGSVFNHLMSSATNKPEVGKGATVLHWTDRSAYFVNFVNSNGKMCIIERAKAVRTDELGMSDAQSYRYERYEDGAAHREHLRYRYGSWWKVNNIDGEITYSKINITFGTMREYYDYSF